MWLKLTGIDFEKIKKHCGKRIKHWLPAFCFLQGFQMPFPFFPLKVMISQVCVEKFAVNAFVSGKINSSNLKELAEDYFKLDENGRMFFTCV